MLIKEKYPPIVTPPKIDPDKQGGVKPEPPDEPPTGPTPTPPPATPPTKEDSDLSIDK